MNSGTGTTGSAQGAQSEEAKRKAEATKQKAATEAKAGGQVVAEEARAVGQKAGELGREHAERRFEQGKERIEGQVDAVSGALDDAAQRLRAENNPLASYADELSGQLSQLSRGIENSTLDDIAVKTRRVARENPGLFVLGSMVAGLAAARFFKASAEREHHERYGDDDGYGYDDDRYDSRSFGGGRSRDDYRGDSYRDDGYRSAPSGTGESYRSPASGAVAPPRPETGSAGVAATSGVGSGTSGGADASGSATAGTASTAPGATSAAPSVSRVPMDSGTSSGTGTAGTTPSNQTKKSGA